MKHRFGQGPLLPIGNLLHFAQIAANNFLGNLSKVPPHFALFLTGGQFSLEKRDLFVEVSCIAVVFDFVGESGPGEAIPNPIKICLEAQTHQNCGRILEDLPENGIEFLARTQRQQIDTDHMVNRAHL